MRYLAVLLVVGIVCRVHSSTRYFYEIGGKYIHIDHYDKLDWFDARDECRNMDAHLVSIQNYEEWNSIKDYLAPYKSYWVDIRDVDSNFDWISDTSGREAPFLKWSNGEPRCQEDYDCVSLTALSHNMKTNCCRRENHYICEANSQPAPVQSPVTEIAHHPSTGYDIIDMRMQ